MEHLVYQQGYSYSYGGSTTKKNNLCKKPLLKKKRNHSGIEHRTYCSVGFNYSHLTIKPSNILLLPYIVSY